jgi:hypothetical protein
MAYGGTRPAARSALADARVRLALRVAAIGALFALAACNGGTLDAYYPGELGHSPPPAVNLPPQDAGMERL